MKLLTEKDVIKLKNIAIEAGKIHLKYFNQNLAIETKIDSSPVTKADKESNDFIVNKLIEEFLGVGIVSEEGYQSWNENTFTVDPLGGTNNFVRGIDKFDVMIGLLSGETPEFGIIHNTIRNEFWYGGRNYGSFYEKGNLKTKIQIKDLNVESANSMFVKDNEHASFIKGKLEKYDLKINKFVYADDYEYIRPYCSIAKQYSNIYPSFKLENYTYWIWDYVATHSFLLGAGGQIKHIKDKSKDFNYTYGESTFEGDIVAVDSKIRLNT